MLISNVTYQRETLSERPIRQPLRLHFQKSYFWGVTSPLRHPPVSRKRDGRCLRTIFDFQNFAPPPTLIFVPPPMGTSPYNFGESNPPPGPNFLTPFWGTFMERHPVTHCTTVPIKFIRKGPNFFFFSSNNFRKFPPPPGTQCYEMRHVPQNRSPSHPMTPWLMRCHPLSPWHSQTPNSSPDLSPKDLQFLILSPKNPSF